VPELVLVCLEAESEEAQTKLEELVVVGPIEDRVLHVAHEILEERPDHHVDDLADLKVD